MEISLFEILLKVLVVGIGALFMFAIPSTIISDMAEDSFLDNVFTFILGSIGLVMFFIVFFAFPAIGVYEFGKLIWSL